MAVLNKRFETKATSQEMKTYISTKLLPNPALSSMLDQAVWDGNILRIDSKLGKGTITLSDYLVVVYFEFSLFGSVAKKAIEASLDNEFKQLGK